MSAISDYASLLIDAGEYAGTNDIAQVFPRLLSLAEAKMNRVMRVADMETVGTVSILDGEGPLPADFLEARLVNVPDGRQINAWSLAELDHRFRKYGGMPQGYAVVGSTINVRPVFTGDLTMTYYAALPALTPSNPTNWLLQKAPDVYLYGLVEEIAIWKKDAAAMAAAREARAMAMQGLALQDERARWGNAQVVVRGNTP